MHGALDLSIQSEQSGFLNLDLSIQSEWLGQKGTVRDPRQTPADSLNQKQYCYSDHRGLLAQIALDPWAYSVAHASEVVEVQPERHAAEVGKS